MAPIQETTPGSAARRARNSSPAPKKLDEIKEAHSLDVTKAAAETLSEAADVKPVTVESKVPAPTARRSPLKIAVFLVLCLSAALLGAGAAFTEQGAALTASVQQKVAQGRVELVQQVTDLRSKVEPIVFEMLESARTYITSLPAAALLMIIGGAAVGGLFSAWLLRFALRRLAARRAAAAGKDKAA
ncbi:unnamed protein product [Polarella glacialis]|uniref:Uncharacterized protein n=1 Tax=Polarella glacialis TaxID=89957 RepID=A0A813KRY7_POLGL|nr:unnamed protein product [Polarella glacialis]|mmetsp:Transcript_17834/g.31573  ORF Transcript_17834/g.31573 Transcript_17834/m.31573 type:complete len:187 (+) Transcript_17834:94-654(+)|eukprot:CAMPEP_0115051852 /NCGR_PEP_ID=MMETSP0227-20121206/2585_1 /TAXON_ID=89957 /ORGANISM="Polarella glacialis, Strain CCMP 1383" /LENGTH=186 /DNA_ID=CAMNT_0002435895 /DNA_START=59 /DNA_END=619 /DNA_ORIENTATION=-